MENISVLSNNSSYYIHDVKNETHRSQEEKILICILSIFSVLGSLGNGLVLCIFKKKALQYSATVFIIALAGTDLIVCLVVIPVVISEKILALRFDFLCKFYSFLITSVVPLSAFIIVAIGVDRYLCICHPFVHIMTVKRAKIIVGILAGFATVLGIITSLCFTINENIGKCAHSTAILSANFIKVYMKLYSLLFFIPLLSVLVLYGMIYRSIFKQRKSKKLQNLERPFSKTNESMVCLNNTIPGAGSPNNLSLMVETVERNQVTRSISMTYKQSGHSDVKTTSSNRRFRSSSSTSSNRRFGSRSSTSYNRRSGSRSSTKGEKERIRVANIKTAMILFIVTVIFIVAFLPSWLIVNGWVKRNIVAYHIYFVYYVANPFIYAFMNRMFREDIVKMIRRCQRCFHQ